MPIIDENLQQVEEARQRLLEKHGGFDGYCKFLLRLEDARKKRAKPRTQKDEKPKRRSRRKGIRHSLTFFHVSSPRNQADRGYGAGFTESLYRLPPRFRGA